MRPRRKRQALLQRDVQALLQLRVAAVDGQEMRRALRAAPGRRLTPRRVSLTIKYLNLNMSILESWLPHEGYIHLDATLRNTPQLVLGF